VQNNLPDWFPDDFQADLEMMDAMHDKQRVLKGFKFVVKGEPDGGSLHFPTPSTKVSVAYSPLVGKRKNDKRRKKGKMRVMKGDNNWGAWDAGHHFEHHPHPSHTDKRRCATCGGTIKKVEHNHEGIGSWVHVDNVKSMSKEFKFYETFQKAGLCTGDGPCDTSPLGDGKNWVTGVGGLPLKVRAVAHALMRDRGMDKSHAIAVAISQNKKWIGAKNTKPKTKAVSAMTIAEWERKKAEAHAKGGHHSDDVKKGIDSDFPGKSQDPSDAGVPCCVGCGDPISHHDDAGCDDCDCTKSPPIETDANMSKWELRGEVTKFSEADNNFFGWAYVTHDEEGQLNVDKSGEFIPVPEDIEKAAYDFVLESRTGDVAHDMGEHSVMIESMVFTPEKCEALGIPDGYLPTGWWAGFHTDNDELFSKVQKGEWMFSIHGSSIKTEV
jgi:hypothetical protein